MPTVEAWVATAAKQKLVRQQVDLGPLGAEEVEVQVEHCGLCHSDLSVLNDDWGISQYPAVLGHAHGVAVADERVQRGRYPGFAPRAPHLYNVVAPLSGHDLTRDLR